MNFKSFARSLSHRNFRLFFIGQTISLSGSWMQQIAMSWLVFQLTHSSFALGLTLFLGQISCLIFTPFIGVWTDRWNKHRVLFITQALAMLLTFVLAALTLSHVVTVHQIMLLSFLLGLVIAFDMPVRQAFLTEMVPEPKDLPNAIAMSATMFNAARLIGPALAGLVLAHTSAGLCFLLNGISFVPVLASLLAMRLPPTNKKTKHKASMKAGLMEGIHYAWSFLPLRNILLLLALGGLMGSAATVLLPEYVVQVLKGGAQSLGWLASAMGMGSLTAALFLATRRTVLGHGTCIGAGVGIMGIGLLSLPFATHLVPALIAMFLTGLGLVLHIAAGNTIIQTITDKDKRGRVLSFYTMAILGLAPIGSFLSGAMGSHIGLTTTLVTMGSIALCGSAAFLLWLPRLNHYVRPIYVRLNILPPAALETAPPIEGI